MLLSDILFILAKVITNQQNGSHRIDMNQFTLRWAKSRLAEYWGEIALN